MKNRALKKGLAALLALSMSVSLTLGNGVALAANDGGADQPNAVDYSKYEPGVTVEEDENSPTGYTAIFVFNDTSVDCSYYELADVSKVQVYSDGMFLFSYDEQEKGTPLDPNANAHDPEEFETGMYPAGGDTSNDLYGGKKIAYYADMEKFDDHMWGVAIPLTSGATYYNYRLTDSKEKSDTAYIDDPANPAMTNTESGVSSRSSMVYVPYSEKMGTGEWADRTVENPREDGKTGTVEFATYKGADNKDRYLGVYLPCGYDKDRTEPYNVLYMSHGAQSEQSGCELRWLNECAAVNIMDNLEGDFIVVTMNNTDLNWDIDKIWAEQELIMAYIEENYNAGTSAANRGFAGLSMGGITASRMYAYHADQFAYFGIWSAADTSALTKLTDEEKADLAAQNCKISLGAGDWDYLLGLTETFAKQLDGLHVGYDWLTVPGSHDWRTWQAMFAETVENFFFKAEPDYTKYDLGPNVIKDANSPTGYTVTFVYEEQSIEDYNKFVSYNGSKVTLEGEISKIELYSDCFMLFDPAEGTPGVIDPALGVAPQRYEAGLAPAGGNGDTAISRSLTKTSAVGPNGGPLWVVSLPLSSGAFVYNFRVFDNAGHSRDRLDDPANPTMTNTATGIHSLSSMVYVPYDAEKQGDSQWADRSVELPREDGKTGTVEFFAYQGANPGVDGTNNSKRGVAVYLPYGYDADRTEPYKVLYISMGNSGDKQGNEMRWLNEGAVPNIMDNLIAEGKAEPFIVVSMNHQDFTFNYEKVWAEYMLIKPEVETRYNVGTSQDYRAFAGLSMGGLTTSRMFLNHTEEFSYYGIWSHAETDIDAFKEKLAGLGDDQPKLMLAAGKWDYLLNKVQALGTELDKLDISYDYLEVPGAHDWETWQMLYAYAVENFFWKDTTDYSEYDLGPNVIKDPNSPTGYTVTFVYEEQSIEDYNKFVSYNGSKVTLEGEISKIELYSDCFMLFDPDKGTPGAIDPALGISPYDYVAGLVPAGGDGKVAISLPLTKTDEVGPNGGPLWVVSVPLSSGAFVYNYRVYDNAGNFRDRLDDPANPTMTNTATGIHSLSSLVYVPYDAEKQGTSQWADRSVELPREDGKTGTVEFFAYQGANPGVDGTENSERGVAVYLPYGYDADRAEPYKVLYISMGNSGDKQGNEMRWLNEGAVPNIMDNLIAEGKAEPFIVVSMNHQDLGWNYDKIWAEYQLIRPLVEEKYNVGTSQAYRSFAGLSMGGITTSNMLLNHPEEFSFYGIWSAANTSISDAAKEALTSMRTKPNLLMGAGKWDFGRESVLQLADSLKEIGLASSYLEVPAAHDWECWQMIYAYAVENFFWKDNSSSSGGGGGSSSRYAITVDSGSHGTVKADKTSASSGSKVTLTVTPSAGYVLSSLTVEDSKGKEIKVTEASGKYTFTMPSSNVTVSASFAAVESGSGLPFTDVKTGDWYYEAVKYAYENDLFSGTSATAFSPNTAMTRAMLVTVLYSLEGNPDVSGTVAFSDAASGTWYYDAVRWATQKGIVSGYSDSLFGSNDTITREQMALILYGYAKAKGYDVTASGSLASFSDAGQVSGWADQAVQWAVGQQLLSGKGNSVLDPKGGATRAEVAQILMRFATEIAG